MEDVKRYPTLEEEENAGMACEAGAGYAATSSGYVSTSEALTDYEATVINDDWDSGIGPYTKPIRGSGL